MNIKMIVSLLVLNIRNHIMRINLKPTENLLFTITLFPLTTYEYEAKDLVTN